MYKKENYIMNKTQIATIAAPIISALAVWLAAKGILFDADTWNAILGAVGTAIGAVIAAKFTTGTSLKDEVGGMRGTTVVTTPEAAAALPNNPDVLSNTEVKIVSK